jgi:large subunit ribosomal protein L18
MDKTTQRRKLRIRRHKRGRKHIIGSADRPRMSIRRTLSHMYAQLIDDATGQTLVAASTLTPDIRQQATYGGNVKAAELVGAKIAELALAKGVKTVCFDRGGSKYHGRVKAVADAARKAGLKF